MSDADRADAVQTMHEAFEQYDRARIRQLCRALGEPYATEDGHGMRAYTWTEVVNLIGGRTLLTRIEKVDPEWLDQWRKGELM